MQAEIKNFQKNDISNSDAYLVHGSNELTW